MLIQFEPFFVDVNVVEALDTIVNSLSTIHKTQEEPTSPWWGIIGTWAGAIVTGIAIYIGSRVPKELENEKTKSELHARFYQHFVSIGFSSQQLAQKIAQTKELLKKVNSNPDLRFATSTDQELLLSREEYLKSHLDLDNKFISFALFLIEEKNFKKEIGDDHSEWIRIGLSILENTKEKLSSSLIDSLDLNKIENDETFKKYCESLNSIRSNTDKYLNKKRTKDQDFITSLDFDTVIDSLKNHPDATAKLTISKFFWADEKLGARFKGLKKGA